MIEEHCKCGIPSRYEHECRRSDVKVPQDLVDARGAKETSEGKRLASVFPKNWQVGDSVVVGWTALTGMQSYAKWLNQKLD